MKKIIALIISFVLLLFMTGCQKENPSSDDTNLPPADFTIPNTDADTSEPMPTGTVETFTHKNLTLEISNVCEKRMDIGIYDNGDSYELPVYTCYPGATLSVINADMSDSTYAEDHQPHPQWDVYDVETDTRTELTNDMEPIVLDKTTDAVFNLGGKRFCIEVRICRIGFPFFLNKNPYPLASQLPVYRAALLSVESRTALYSSVYMKPCESGC